MLDRLVLVLIDIDLNDFEILALTAQLVEHGTDGAAWRTPWRPKIDEDGLVRLNDLCFEGLIRNV
jgi:hypothetical protein